jgi:hypothetical protein
MSLASLNKSILLQLYAYVYLYVAELILMLSLLIAGLTSGFMADWHTRLS